jgi:hypothetical protein
VCLLWNYIKSLLSTLAIIFNIYDILYSCKQGRRNGGGGGPGAHAPPPPPPNFFKGLKVPFLWWKVPFFVMKSALFVRANVAVDTKLTSKVPFLFGNCHFRSPEKKWVHENVSFRSVYDGQLQLCMYIYSVPVNSMWTFSSTCLHIFHRLWLHEQSLW